MKKTARKTPLTLLGIWNILPIGNWTWFNDRSLKRLQTLTGRKLGVFCYMKDDLNYECFTQRSTELLRKDLEKLSPARQAALVKKLSSDYYKRAKPLQQMLEKLAKRDFAKLDNRRLANTIEALADAWSDVTMQIWYAVLLDIWYPSPKEKAELKGILATARDHCGHLHAQSDRIEHSMYTEAAKRLGLSEREAYFLIQPELAEALRKGSADRRTIKKHLELWVESNHTGKVRTYGGREAEKILKKFETPSLGAKRSGILKGMPACAGKVRGKVRIITLDREFPSFKKGEILVSIQTMVHYLPVMQKAKAILTEFGGMTSHAAIVSRELGKPCVVGIPGLIASLKTGDMVEVDADNGTITKL